MNKRVALLATGDELINGDILNTNAQFFTKTFVKHGIQPGQQMIIGDSALEIEQAARYLLQNHSALITIGGLGPTSDDQTRYGLTQALDLPLVFYTEAWDWLVERFQSKGYTLPIPENNRQQALFPKGAQPLQNHNGSAAACYIAHTYQGALRDVFMLPGPPTETCPIFNTAVIPTLMAQHYCQETHHHVWLLHQVSEGQLASQLDPLIPQLVGCKLGYRLDYPHLEIKLTAYTAAELAAGSARIIPFFKDHILTEQHKIC